MIQDFLLSIPHQLLLVQYKLFLRIAATEHVGRIDLTPSSPPFVDSIDTLFFPQELLFMFLPLHLQFCHLRVLPFPQPLFLLGLQPFLRTEVEVTPVAVTRRRLRTGLLRRQR